LLPWGVAPDARARNNPGLITAGAQQFQPAVPLVNSGVDGPGLRFQLPRGNWDLAELCLRLTKTEEGAVNLGIEFSSVRPNSALRVSSRR
jgi:hypothetical protein